MPTKMGSGIGSKLQAESEKLRNLSLFVTLYLSLAASARERISVFTCATDDCPRCAPLARPLDGMLLSDAQSLDHRTIACIADAAKIVEQSPATSNQEEQASP